MSNAALVAGMAERTKDALAVQEARHAKAVGLLEDRIVALEELIKALPTPENGKDGRDGVDGKDGRDGVDGKNGADGLKGLDGESGKDGRDGRDGKDGIASVDEIRSIAEKAVDDRLEAVVQKRVAESFAAQPILRYRDLYQPGAEYQPGECVTWGGQLYHCNEPTSSKPGDSKAWALAVKRGRDGRDAK